MIRYPVERTKYCKTVGQIRVDNIAEILKELGFGIKTEEPECHGPDIWGFKEHKPVLAIEVLNWQRKVYMDAKRAESIRENLSNPYYEDSRKLLVFSFWKNIKKRMNHFEGLNIDFLEIGFQTQPIDYYVWFLNRGQADDMRYNNSETKDSVRERLVAYLTARNLI